jgi:hypothetical protein
MATQMACEHVLDDLIDLELRTVSPAMRPRLRPIAAETRDAIIEIAAR